LDDGTTSTRPGIRDNTFEYKVYPTVTTDELTFDLTVLNPKPLTISIFNTMGIKTREYLFKNISWGRNQFKLDVGNLTAGHYIYHIQAGNNSATGKIQILK